MAINPGSDILSDALMAAEPLRAKAAADRLASLAAGDASAVPAFDEAMAAQLDGPQAGALKNPVTAVSIGSQATVVDKPANPYEQFESAMLKTFFETMLPSNANSVFGSGFAGGVWKSMLAQSLGTSVSHTKRLGIAQELEARARRAKS